MFPDRSCIQDIDHDPVLVYGGNLLTMVLAMLVIISNKYQKKCGGWSTNLIGRMRLVQMMTQYFTNRMA